MKGVTIFKKNQKAIFILTHESGTFLERHYTLQLLCMSVSSPQLKDHHQSLTDMPECLVSLVYWFSPNTFSFHNIHRTSERRKLSLACRLNWRNTQTSISWQNCPSVHNLHSNSKGSSAVSSQPCSSSVPFPAEVSGIVQGT